MADSGYGCTGTRGKLKFCYLRAVRLLYVQFKGRGGGGGGAVVNVERAGGRTPLLCFVKAIK